MISIYFIRKIRTSQNILFAYFTLSYTTVCNAETLYDTLWQLVLPMHFIAFDNKEKGKV